MIASYTQLMVLQLNFREVKLNVPVFNWSTTVFSKMKSKLIYIVRTVNETQSAKQKR